MLVAFGLVLFIAVILYFSLRIIVGWVLSPEAVKAMDGFMDRLINLVGKLFILLIAGIVIYALLFMSK